MFEDELGPVRCASYTYARRHPKVLGKIGGWAPPVQPTFPQLFVFTATFAVLWKTWTLWDGLVPVPAGRLVILIGLPMLCAWALRRSRFEGRSLPRTAIALLTYAVRPPGGWIAGKPQRDRPVVVDWRSHRVWLGES